MICRCKLDISTESKPTTVIAPTLEAARYNKIVDPLPPTPITV
jgi:hypothetical protein